MLFVEKVVAKSAAEQFIILVAQSTTVLDRLARLTMRRGQGENFNRTLTCDWQDALAIAAHLTALIVGICGALSADSKCLRLRLD